MSKTDIQIRGVPIETRDRVKRRASKQGRSMSEYLLSLIERDLSLPTPEEFARRLSKVSSVDLGRPAARDIEELRNERDASFDTQRSRRRRRSS